MYKTVLGCADVAKKEYPEEKYFGIEFYGECVYGPGSKDTYARDGILDDDKCWEGVGKPSTIQVYKFP